MGKVYVSWKSVENFVENVENFIRNEHPTCPGVYGIPRGGLVFAVMLSHKLSIPMLMSPVEGCLIVDDICDSGESLVHYVKNTSNPDEANKYIIATMFYRDNWLDIKPDYYMEEKHDDWLIFCWESSLKSTLDQYLDDEIWTDLPGYETRYRVSSKGNVFGKLSNKLLTYTDKVNLYAYKGDTGTLFKKADLVAGAFLELDFTNPYHNRVLFKDGDTSNIQVSNLYVEDLSDLDNEEWRLIDRWKGYNLNPWYYVSSLGRIKVIARDVIANVRGQQLIKKYPSHILTATPDSDGYLNVELPDINGDYHTAYVHRLVATFFLSKDVNDTEVNHIDGVKTNNKVSNLEWCTHQENMQHAIDSGLMCWQK